MLTIFSIPKAFEGHMDVIQRNAIQSWKRLDPNCQVILIGDDPGTAEVAEELGVSNIPQVARNEFGTPLLDSAYQLAEDAATNPYLCYVNADIILTSSLIDAFKKVREQTDRFFMTARRWDYSQDTLLEYDQDWETRLLGDVSVNGKLAHFSAIDFWVYPKGLLEGIPPLAVGRIAFESWCLYKARQMKADVIDSTDVVMSIHQDHDYSHHPEGELGIGTGIEAQRNRAMVGGAPYFFCIRDRTHKLTHNGLKRTLDGWKLWRSLRTSKVLYPKMPLPLKLSCMMLNGFFDNLRKVLRSIRMLTPLGQPNKGA